MLLGEGDEVLVEVEDRHERGRVRGVADHDRDRLGDRVDHRPLQRGEEAGRRVGGDRADRAARHEEAEGVDGVGGIGHNHHVARTGDRLRHVGEAFLGAERRHDLRVGIDLHAEAAGVIGRLGAAQAGNALGGGVAVDPVLGDRLDQLVLDVLRRLQVRVAHAEVDDVGASLAGRRLDAVDLLENVGRQALDAVELGHGCMSRPRVGLNRAAERRVQANHGRSSNLPRRTAPYSGSLRSKSETEALQGVVAKLP